MKRLVKLTLGAGLITIPLLSGAVPGYVTDTSGAIVRTNFGECWHTSDWTPAMAVEGCEGTLAEANPVTMKEVSERREDHLTLSDAGEALFAFDKAHLSPGTRAKLDELSSHIKTYQRVDHITITGHTDRLGSDSYNMRLSKRRAEAVRRYMVDQQAADPSVFEVVPRGESEPVVGCEGVRNRKKLISCLAPNRRVVIDVSGVGTRVDRVDNGH
jgi:OmpA-OmpF porin, OOP family